MAADLVQLDGVWRVFPRGQVVALRDIAFSIRREDHIAISGPSGSGKSTLLHLAGGLDRPTKGRVFFDGSEPKAPADWAALRARRVGFVFQSFYLLGGFTAAENVEIPMFGVWRSERERRRRVASLLDRVGLSHRCGHRVSELSGGESQRVAIARALANSPDLILADEPTGNLDSHSAEEILALLEDLHEREGITLVVVTHDPGVSWRANRIVGLLDGRIVSDERNGGRG
ncbi:MAG: ABC transporter ATP-binding protein [Bryobacteraceae bacterium]